MKRIVLATLNARYTHTSLGLRYIFANLNDLQDSAEIQEYVINENITEICEKLLKNNPDIIGLSVYIWNASDIRDIVDTIKKISSGTIIILGGPEVSHNPIRLDFSAADYIIQGEGEKEFYKLCNDILNNVLPVEKIIKAEIPDIDSLQLPYEFYTDNDIQNRVIYVEASRGCPFRCEFCLSSIDRAVRYFNLDDIISSLSVLWERGARKFKFIDRTFNLKIENAIKILDFFLEKEPPYLIHFEMIPENLPSVLKEKIKMFPPASLQFEVGIQTLNHEVAKNISRNLDFVKIKENLKFLEEETKVHLHVDLIIGLPGETIESFANNLNILFSLTKAEIQIGVLKKLSGTKINRHDDEFGMVYSDLPPYEILKNDKISFNEMQKLKRFARFWDLVYNSGNFKTTISLLWEETDVYSGFKFFSEWLYEQTQSTWQISMARMAELLFKFVTEEKNREKEYVASVIIKDILKIEGRKLPPFLREYSYLKENYEKKNLANINKRQIKHID